MSSIPTCTISCSRSKVSRLRLKQRWAIGVALLVEGPSFRPQKKRTLWPQSPSSPQFHRYCEICIRLCLIRRTNFESVGGLFEGWLCCHCCPAVPSSWQLTCSLAPASRLPGLRHSTWYTQDCYQDPQLTRPAATLFPSASNHAIFPRRRHRKLAALPEQCAHRPLSSARGTLSLAEPLIFTPLIPKSCRKWWSAISLLVALCTRVRVWQSSQTSTR